MAPDLKQVAALFNDCIETIRNEKHDHLEAMARKWLTEARYAVMRKVEAEYYKLASSVGNPTAQTGWSLDPSQSFYISTPNLAAVLRPYRFAIEENLRKLMTDCGFNATVGHYSGTLEDHYYIVIKFPHRITNHDFSQRYTLEIEDSFSKDMASSLSRLITAGDTAASGSTTAEASGSGGSGVVTRSGAGRGRGQVQRRGRGRGRGRKRR